MPALVRAALIERYNVSEDDIAKCGLEWSALDAIFNDHLTRAADLQLTASYIADRLRDVKNVHSLKYRVKDAEHLIEKIIRKRCADPAADITPENYRERVTDLVGVRALHLFKDDWSTIHDQIVSAWALFEPPVANVRKGDSDVLSTMFAAKGCTINEHPFGYRSVHYIVKSQPSKDVVLAEIQVRTIFEEGWSEIDHRIRYPYDPNNVLLSQFLVIFNRLAGSADEMGSFISVLKRELDAHKLEQVTATTAYEKVTQEVNQHIEALKITKEQKQALEDRVKQSIEDMREKMVMYSAAFSRGSTISDVLAALEENAVARWPVFNDIPASRLQRAVKRVQGDVERTAPKKNKK